MSQRGASLYQHKEVTPDEVLTFYLSRESHLTEKGFKKTEGKEYERDGHRYDLLSKKVNGTRATIKLVHDSFEEELLRFFDSLFTGCQTDPGSAASVRIPRALLKWYLDDYKAIVQPIFSSTINRAQQPVLPLPTTYLEQSTPPPQNS